MELGQPGHANIDGRDRDLVSTAPSADGLAFLLAEHRLHRKMCWRLCDLATSGSYRPALMAQVLDVIRHDLTLHIIDEEEDFFPLLRARCEPNDQIDRVLLRLSEEHAGDLPGSERARDALTRCLVQRKAPPSVAGVTDALTAFAAQQLQHMSLENAVTIPLARRRLAPDDIAKLGAAFTERRRRLSTRAG